MKMTYVYVMRVAVTDRVEVELVLTMKRVILQLDKLNYHGS